MDEWYLVKHAFPGPLASPSNLLAIDIEYKRHWYQQRSKPTSDAARRPNSDIMIPVSRQQKSTKQTDRHLHWCHHQGKGTGKATPQERVRCNSRRSVFGKCINEIVQRRLEDGEETCTQHDQTDDRGNPMKLRVRRPAHDELSRSEEHRSKHHRWQTSLRHCAVTSRVIRLVVQRLVIRIDGRTKTRTEEDAQEWQCSRDRRPPSNLAEDDGHTAELKVQNSVTKACVQSDEEADRRHQQLHGADQELATQLREADVPLFELGVQSPVAGLVTQAPRFVDKELGWVGFIDEDYVDYDDEALDYASEVLSPAPAEGGRGNKSC